MASACWQPSRACPDGSRSDPGSCTRLVLGHEHGAALAALQQARQESGRGGRVDRLLPRGVPVQREEFLPAVEPVRQPVRGMHRERGLADPGHPADRVDAHHPTHPRRDLHQLLKFPLPPGERGDVAGQLAGRRHGLVRPPRTSPGQGRPDAARRPAAGSCPCGVVAMPHSRSLTDRGISLADSASCSWVSRASARSFRSKAAKVTGGSATASPLARRRRPPRRAYAARNSVLPSYPAPVGAASLTRREPERSPGIGHLWDGRTSNKMDTP